MKKILLISMPLLIAACHIEHVDYVDEPVYRTSPRVWEKDRHHHRQHGHTALQGPMVHPREAPSQGPSVHPQREERRPYVAPRSEGPRVHANDNSSEGPAVHPQARSQGPRVRANDNSSEGPAVHPQVRSQGPVVHP